MLSSFLPVSLLLGTVTAPASVAVDPYKEVIRAFDPDVDANAELVVRRNFPDTGVEWLYQFKTSTQGSGSIFLEFVHPSNYQGVQVIMDTKQIRQYEPKKKLILVAPSPLRHEPSETERLNLLKLNYKAVYEGSKRIAGRSASVVRLVPDSSALYTRKIWVDENALFMLKHEISGGGTSGTDTIFQVLQFKSLGSAQTFNFASNRDTHAKQVADPKVINDPTLVAGLVGFTAPARFDLPYGVKELVRQVHPSEDMEYSPIRIKATDGVAALTVWMWKASGSRSSRSLVLNPNRFSAMARSGTVGVFVEGDYPEAARKKIAESYAQAYRTGERS